MAYNETIALKLRESLHDRTAFTEKGMFGGICFLVDDKMCVCTKTDKATGEDRLLCRISDADYAREIETADVSPMQHGKTAMRNFVYVSENGFRSKNKLDAWVEMCLKYNPEAKRSK